MSGLFSGSLQKRLSVLSFGRLFITTLILGSSLLIPDHGKNILQIPSNDQLYVLISIAYFYSLVCLLLIKPFRNSVWLIFSQILGDTVFITAFVYISGKDNSIFIFLYFFSIIAGALFLDRARLFLLVLLATLFYTGSILKTAPLDALWHGNLTGYIWTHRFTLYKMGLHTLALWGIAILTSILSAELLKRKAQLVEKTKAYQNLERFNENILQSIASGILTVDSRGAITYINSAGKRILGIEDRPILHKNIQEIFPALAKHTHTHTPQESTRHYSTPYHGPNSENKLIGYSISTLYDAENLPTGKIFIFQDLTRYKAMERRVHESEKLASIGRFAAGLAHEIRNPLTSLSGSIQLLKDSLDLKGVEQELMEIVLRETNRLNRLVSDFLQFSQFGKENYQPVRLHQLIEEILSILEKKHDGSAIHFTNELPEDLILHSDRDRLKQVFWNILINAVQSKDKRALTVTIKGFFSSSQEDRPSQAKNDLYTILIEDNGKGIPKPIMKKIFEPFFTTRPDGTGLGLSIAYQIITSLGGTISVSSREGVGTSFKITLPV